MKLTTLLFVLPLLALSLVGCDQKTVKNSSSSSNNYCLQYPYAQGCNTGNTTVGTSTGATTGGTANCTTQAYLQSCPDYVNQYWSCYYSPTQAKCQSFCLNFPTTPYCTGSTNGTSSGGTTTGGSIDPSLYGSLYPQGIPSDSCVAAQDSYPYDGITAFDTRIAQMTIAGRGLTSDADKPMDPSASNASSYVNTSSELMSKAAATQFISGGTDAKVKIRFKVMPQPNTSNSGSTVCAGRESGSPILYGGYTKLFYNVHVVPVDNTSIRHQVHFGSEYNATRINSCSDAINLSSYTAQYPNGFFVVVSNVQANWNCSYNTSYAQANGMNNCTAFKPVRKSDCWQMKIEVAVDGSKDFP